MTTSWPEPGLRLIGGVPTGSLPTLLSFRMVSMDPMVLFEDEFILVVEKPAGLVVHDGDDSVAGWFLRKTPTIKNQSWPDPTRPGIVHRLDQETSGALVLAKTTESLRKLQEAFKAHEIKKIYWALVFGHPDPEQGSVDVAIGRHPNRKTPMTVIPVEEVARGKVRAASTEYRTIKNFKEAALVEAILHTGRTHQIRLHMKYLGHPILGDDIYNTKPSKRFSKEHGITRQMLHAKILGFSHPETGEWVECTAALPSDFQKTIDRLEQRV